MAEYVALLLNDVVVGPRARVEKKKECGENRSPPLRRKRPLPSPPSLFLALSGALAAAGPRHSSSTRGGTRSSAPRGALLHPSELSARTRAPPNTTLYFGLASHSPAAAAALPRAAAPPPRPSPAHENKNNQQAPCRQRLCGRPPPVAPPPVLLSALRPDRPASPPPPRPPERPRLRLPRRPHAPRRDLPGAALGRVDVRVRAHAAAAHPQGLRQGAHDGAQPPPGAAGDPPHAHGRVSFYLSGVLLCLLFRWGSFSLLFFFARSTSC